jgi:hypothetical protein
MIEEVQWNHPVLGRITELVCETHKNLLLYCLKTLGIGSNGRDTDKTVCYRCLYDGYSFRQWVRNIDL